MRQSTRTVPPPSSSTSDNPRLARVSSAIRAGDVSRACRLLEGEVRKDPSGLGLRLQLARLKEGTGDREGAIAEHTRILRFAPENVASANAVGQLLAGGRLSHNATLDTVGLAACLTHKTVDRDLVGAAALDLLSRNGCLAPVLAHARSHGAEAASRSVLSRRSAPMVRDPLLISVLENCVVANLDVEQLLTAMRRELLLQVPRDRLSEPDLTRFATALAAQCWANEYVFYAGADESDAVGRLPPMEHALTGDTTAQRAHLLRALYQNPLFTLPSRITAEIAVTFRPESFSRLLSKLVEEHDEFRTSLSSVTSIGSIEQATSLKVKAQYEKHPYPRWRGTAVYPNGRFAEYLETFLTKREISFLNAPFEVLIAGCGTGLQAVSAALDYGRNAHVTGLDISSASLGYAAMMGRRFETRNLALTLGDIDRIDTFAPSWQGRFHVIECCGVLHHMADPFGAWHKLLDCLAPGGIMLVGLYSQLARSDLETLRKESEYPGSGADDDALRRYRNHLIARGPDTPGAAYLNARDTFTTSGFRDFFLHVSEKTTTLAELAAFLDANDLAFRGFVNAPYAALARRFPDEKWPGSLEHWAELEREHPRMFLGMYQFWLTRR